MAEKNFVHLHCHSEYSLLDGAARIKDMIEKAAKLGMPALAITDHGVMYGAIDFYRKVKEAGVKPIIGCEVYVSPTSRFDRTQKVNGDESYYHLVLLARNNTGYENLMKLVTIGFFDGFYYKPRIDDEVLAEHAEGLIGLSACLGGRIPKLILAGRYDAAKALAQKYRDLFGEGNFYLEIQDHGMAEQKTVNEALFRMADETGIPLVLTNDFHYIENEDAKVHDVLLCIGTGSTLAEPNRLRFETEEFYLKSADEMAALFPDRPELLANSLAIAEACNVEIELEQILLPKYEVPEGETLDSYFEKLCREGAVCRYGEEIPGDVRERLDYEIAMIKQMGFPGYFLVVQDFVNWAKSQGIKVGPGRGSAAGSLVAYVLNITNIDPLKYDLLFERFLNPSRVTMPDIDIDFCFERRGEVIDYVTKKYGEDKVAQIITFGTMAARAAIRDAGRVFDVPYGVVDKIAKLVPEGLYKNKQWTIKAALENSPELGERYQNDETARQIIDAARGLDGLARQDSIHAAGVVISDEELTKHTPLQRKGDAEIVTQYNMGAISEIGLLKMDFLGLRTLTVIDNAVKIVKRTKDTEIDIDAISFDDEKTFEMLRKGEAIGVFQLESSGMRGLLRDLQVSVFDELISLISLYRPGPMQLIGDYVERKHGRRPVEYLHPSMEQILKSTYGIMIYQEQVMRIASDMAGYTMAEADTLRKAMSKKEGKVFAGLKEKFVAGAVEKGINKKVAERVFNQIGEFASYGFNKSHATAYAYIAYQTAHLKANYPVEFMAALLTSIKGNKDKVAQYVNECRRLEIEVLPPDVNESFSDFTVVGDSIRFGLSAVRNVGEGAIESIIEERRKGGSFKSIHDFCNRVDLNLINKRAIESLIKGGAFDSLGMTRRGLSVVFENAVDIGARKQRDDAAGVMSLFGTDEGTSTLKGPAISDAGEWERMELLAFEKEMLGLYVTDHPLLEVEKALKERTEYSIADLMEQKDGTVAQIGGIISKVTRLTTKKGDPMARIDLEDLEGTIEVLVFPKVYEQFRELFEEDKLVCVKGRLDRKEDESKLIAQELVALDEAGKPGPRASKLYLTIDSSRFEKQVLDELKSVIGNYPGETPVVMRVRDGDQLVTLSLGGGRRVGTGNGIFAELKALLGEDGVELN
ncbi:MAG: DNA polymerase III subunit alpha [Actinobacteria bacterium]|nr:DNA polymerase III subunit alpha [Actinomycetota bacterium]